MKFTEKLDLTLKSDWSERRMALIRQFVTDEDNYMPHVWGNPNEALAHMWASNPDDLVAEYFIQSHARDLINLINDDFVERLSCDERESTDFNELVSGMNEREKFVATQKFENIRDKYVGYTSFTKIKYDNKVDFSGEILVPEYIYDLVKAVYHESQNFAYKIFKIKMEVQSLFRALTLDYSTKVHANAKANEQAKVASLKSFIESLQTRQDKPTMAQEYLKGKAAMIADEAPGNWNDDITT
ncbi:hypothetical protein ATI02_4329 [Pseudomonas baetica]|uniref:Uncharacterized protein n=1 Tax=Pseudomonas baetica TaxID=674054 RepID=A0ABX4Q3N8_9PSED|nr:hypothetical protein [Pseudomonas baetica]PKA71351.1 hypothetical protein ATI02_4329 [Pseudomonas baetica]PTC19850.1 hypothetical protein C0J26_07585 [Pseudomonas baetica]